MVSTVLKFRYIYCLNHLLLVYITCIPIFSSQNNQLKLHVLGLVSHVLKQFEHLIKIYNQYSRLIEPNF